MNYLAAKFLSSFHKIYSLACLVLRIKWHDKFYVLYIIKVKQFIVDSDYLLLDEECDTFFVPFDKILCLCLFSFVFLVLLSQLQVANFNLI